MTPKAGARIRILTGPFHPDLEAALRTHLENLATSGEEESRLPSFAVVTPSREMRRYLKHLITLGWGMTLAGAYLLTAHHLSQRIARAAGGAAPLKRADDLVLVELVRNLILEEDFPADWKRLVRTAGGAGALHRTLRDLEEALVPAGGEEGNPLLRLHDRYQGRRKELGLGTTSDPVEAAVERSRESAFLQGLEHVIYYGFYDMTQLQINLLGEVSSVCPTTVLLPCMPGHRAYEFGNDFLEALTTRFPEAEFQAATGRQPPTDLSKERSPEGMGLLGDPPLLQPALDRLFSEGAENHQAALDGSALRSFTASGPEAEVETAAKEILRWKEEEGFDFHKMGVVARHLSPYLPYLPAVFDAHAIPFRTPETQPVSRLPWAKTLSALNRVVADDFPGADLLELLASPFFLAAEGDTSSGDTARLLVRRLTLVQGIGEWEKVARSPPGRWVREEGSSPVSVGEVKTFQKHLSVLIEAARDFPERCSWGEMAEAYRKLTGKVLDLSSLPEGGTDGSASDPARAPSEHLEDVLGILGDRGRIREETDARGFFSALGEHLRAYPVPVRDPDHPAVEVVNAMDARGRGFQCLAIMGLQEGAWPWRAPADPFLNDAARARLSQAHGVRLLTGSAGVEEERLLFALALASARSRVALTWQRSGEDGKPLVRSSYVHELARALGRIDGDLPGTVRVPRRIEDRFEERATSDLFWTPSEWTARLLLRGRNPETLRAVRGLAPEVLHRCFEAGTHLDHIGPSLTDRDGIAGKLPELWKELREKGWSPTALETYARCPFQFFAGHVLDLEELEDPEEVTELEALDVGGLLHGILHRVFKGWKPEDSAGTSRLLAEAVEATLREFEETNPIAYPLVWRATREEIEALARDYVQKELERLRAEGFSPVAFEQTVEAALPKDARLPSFLRGMKVKGRMDRIDRREGEAGVELRVVDYKFRSGKRRPKRNLEQEALRGRMLQPAFYVLLAEAWEQGARAGAELHYLAPRWPEPTGGRDEFPPAAWESPWAAEMSDTLAGMLKGVRDGQFYIIPHDGDYGYCNDCPYQTLCRRNHRPTRYRRKADPRTHRIEDLSEKKWPPET